MLRILGGRCFRLRAIMYVREAMMARQTRPPTTPPAMAPLCEGFVGLLGVLDGLGVGEALAFTLLWDLAAFRENMSSRAVKFQPPSGAVRVAFADGLVTIIR